MKIDSSKWINTLPLSKVTNKENYEMDADRWANTIPKKKNNNSFRKYTVSATLFIVGLMFVSAIKNETRNLQKEIDNLRSSINAIEQNLHHTILDHQFITSPENISLLAEEYLENDFLHYKKSQITKLNNNKMEIFSTSTENYELKNLKRDNNSLSNKIKSEVISKIEKKKTELRKLQELYSHPKKLPEEIKITVAKKIEKTRADLKKLYSYPQDAINLKKIQKWGAIQVVKVFLGIPVVPGK